jgi:hypothetical protein
VSDFFAQVMRRAESGQLGRDIATQVRADYARAGVVYKPCPAEIAEAQRRALALKAARTTPALSRAA